MAPAVPSTVVVHPLVLLSVVDHYNRVAKDTRKRCVGVLLGSSHNQRVDITNSFAIPFDEDENDPSVWFLDHVYLEQMFTMFKKVSAKEVILGWYSTGPKIRSSDIDINEVLRRYHPSPVLCIIDVQPKELGIPTDAYCSVPEIKEGEIVSRTFQHVPSQIGAYEAEEIGVEQLLRDIKDTSISTMVNQVSHKLNSLKGLETRLLDIREYLENVIAGRLPLNNDITYELQDIFNLLPNLNVEELVKGFAVKTNDSMLAIYLASLVRSVIAMHNLINNKIENRDAERKSLKADTDKEESKDEKKDGEGEKDGDKKGADVQK